MWELVKETEEYKCWLCLDDMIFVNKTYHLQNSIGRKIGIRCQYVDMPMQEKWVMIKDVTKGKIIFDNNIKIQGGLYGLRYNYSIIKNFNFSNLTKDIYKYIKNDEDKCRYIKSNETIEVICPDCNFVKKNTFANLKYNKFSCDNCSDGISFPEKFVNNLLNQLNIEYKKQFMFKDFGYMYDFYLPEYNTIIEVHGEQHYEECTGFKKWKSYEEEHENDLRKYDLAVLNGYEYNKNFFIIDARESTLEWMKDKILECKLSEVFNLSQVNWCQCLEYASSSIQHEIWDYWRIHVNENNECISLEDIGKIFHFDRGTISRYLKNGTLCGKCYYNSQEQNTRLNSLGYYIVDILENKEIFYEHTLIAEESLDINSGNITYNCQHHRDNNNFKLLHKRYLCFYKDNYTSFEDIMSKYKEQEQKEILIKQRMVLLDTLNKVLRKKEVKQRLEDARVISIDEYGNILEYNNAHQIVCELNTHVGAVYNPLNEQIEAYINDTFYYFIKKQNYKDNYDYVSDLKNKRIDYECEQEEKKLKVVAIDSNYNKEYLKISSDNDKYLKIKEKCENTFNRNHNYANNVVDNVFYVYQKDERLITKEMINRDFNIYNKLNSNNRNTRVFVFDQITKQSQIYDGINKCAKDINGSRSSIGQICNESDSCTHRYKQGRYLIYFLQQWELIPYEKQQQIIKLGRHIK